MTTTTATDDIDHPMVCECCDAVLWQIASTRVCDTNSPIECWDCHEDHVRGCPTCQA